MFIHSRREILYPSDVASSYILNRGWIDRSTKRIPSYKEVTHTTEDDVKGDDDDDGNDDDSVTELSSKLAETQLDDRAVVQYLGTDVGVVN